GGKDAITHYKPLNHFAEHTHVQLSLETGRTHQIRVHMQYLGYPLIGDTVYGGGFKMPKNKRESLLAALRSMPRQALHAKKLSLTHPRSGATVRFEAERPQDLANLLTVLAED
ncbi:MAG: pseudouridine synthase, partial [Proteobacteria bacterium]|nr:pseudouridine synthase [Pseudomonadota bacterium]